jgi:transmembrane sensor
MRDTTEHHILEQAALWFARQEDNALSDADQRAFDDWLAASARHRAVYHEVSGIWYETALLPKPAMQDNVIPLPAKTARQRRSVFTRWQSVAATGLFAAFALSGAYIYDVPTRMQADIYTAKGQSERVTLPDGSTVELNTATALEVLYTPQERKIRLLKGEAVFTVAADKTRPFRVETNEGEATALGTIYAVRQEPQSTEVTVLESKVVIKGSADHAPATVLNADEMAHFTRSSVSSISTIDADSATAWRRGKLMVTDQPLGEVINELNRYPAGLIRITDPEIRDQRVSGVFDTKNTSKVISDLENALNIRSTRLSNYLILLHR